MAIKLNKKTVTKNRTEEEQRRLQEKAYPKDNLNSVMKSREARQAQQQQETDRVNQILADVQRKKKERETQQAYDRITAEAKSRLPGTVWRYNYAPPDLNAQGNFKGGIKSVNQQSSGKIYPAAQDALRAQWERNHPKQPDPIKEEQAQMAKEDPEGYNEYKKQLARYNEMNYWKRLQTRYKGQEEEAQNKLNNIIDSVGVDFAPEGETPYRVKDRTNHYYQNPQYRAQIDEIFYDSIAGEGAYKKRKDTFTNDVAGWEKEDQLELELGQAWEAYEKGQPEEAYKILTGKDDIEKYKKDIEAAQHAGEVAEEKLKGYQDVENAPYLALGMTEGQYLRELQKNLDSGAYDPETAKFVKDYIFYSQAPDSAKSREYSEYMQQGIESGMFDNAGDLNMMSTGKVQADLADLKRRKAQAAANSRNWDEYNEELREEQKSRMTYNSLNEFGVQDNYVTGMNLKAKPNAREMFDRYPNIFLNPDNAEEYFDGLLYDQVHGEGSFKNIIENGTDEEFDRAQAEVDDLWQRIENGTVSKLETAGSERMNELAAKVYGGESNLDRQIKARQDELTRRETISRYSGLEGAEYDPSLVNDPVAYQTYLENGGMVGNDNFLYWVINNINGTENEYGSGFIGELREVQEAENDYRKYAFMTPDMVKKYNQLYRENRLDEARAFLSAIDPYISQMASGRAEEIREQASKGNYGGLYGAATVLRQPFAGLSGSVAVLSALMGNEDAKNPNSGWYKWQRMNNTTRGARAESWGNFFADKFGEQYRGTGEWLNGVTYSIADNIMAMAIARGSGAAFNYNMSSKAAQRVIQFVMSSSAASSSMVDKITNGMDPTEAALYAVGNGMIEAITEKYSIEALLQPNVRDMLGDWKKVGKFLLKNTIAEGTEEGASDVLNTIWDEMLSGIYGHESELTTQYNALIADGMKPEDATRQVLRGWLANTGSDMLAGALSGFVMSGGRTAMNTVEQQKAGRKIRNKSNTTAGKTGVEQLIEAARGMDADTESRRMAEELNEKVQSGKKVSSGEAGRLAQNILYETNETMGNIARDTIERMVRDTMKENGATPEQIERTAGIVTDAVVKNKKLTKGEMATVAEVKQAIEAYRHLMTNEGKLEAGITVRMNPEGDVTRSVRETVGRLLNGENAEKVDHRISRDIMQGVQSMVLANDEDLANVQNGKRTKTGMDAIVDNEIVQVTGKEGDSYIVKTADGTEKKVSAAAVTAVDTMAGAIMAYTEGNGKSVLGDQAFGTIAKGAEQNKKMAPAKYIAEAVKIYMAARTGGQMPGTILADSTANDIWAAAQEENKQATQDRQAAGQLKVEAGKGTASFDGAEYGTDAWKEKIRGLSKQIRNQMGAVAEYAKRIGLHVEFINDPENEAIFGSEDRSTSRITINVAGREADLKVGGKTVLGENHHLLVVAAHEFTHWLEQNSTESYDELRQFIFDKIRAGGQSVEALVMNKIDAYRSVAKQDLSVEDAMAEIVADACDQVLGSEKVAREIEQSNPNLYNKIKSFVTNLVARIRAAAAGMSTSASAEARLLQDWADELEDRWLKTLREAQGRAEERTETEEKTNVSFSINQLGLKEINKEDRENIKSRGGIVVDNINDLLQVINEAKTTNKQTHVFIGIISEQTKERLKKETGNANLFKDGDYAFGFTYDNIRHFDKHFETDMDVAGGILEVFRLFVNHDTATAETDKTNHTKLVLTKAENTYEFLGVADLSRRRRNAIVKTIYLTKGNIKNWRSLNPAVSLSTSTNYAGSLLPNKNIAQKNNNVNKQSIRNISEQDQAYADAVEHGDIQAATDMLMDKLAHSENIIPFNAPEWYAGEHMDVAKMIKQLNSDTVPEEILSAAEKMASYVPDNGVLVPMPNHHGEVNEDTDTMILARVISEMIGRPVVAALEGADRESRFKSKENGGKGIQAEEMGFRQVEELPEGTVPIFIDNVVGSGVTAQAARQALGGGITLAYAKSVRSKGIEGLKRATVTYDKNGNLIPLSERFNPEKRDIRYSIRQGDMEINRWMQGLTASSLQTEQERTMLKQWQETMGSLNMARHAVYERRAELAKLEAKPNPTAYDKNEIIKKRNQLEIWQKKADRYEKQLAKATGEKGFASLMRKQSRIMNDLVNGRTADEVRGTVDAINAELENVQKEMETRKERLKQLAAKEAVIRIRQQLNSAGLKRIAAKLKSDLNSELSNTEIENRLALMALKMKEGNIDEEDVTELADMLIGKMRRTYDSYILDELRGRTITLSQSQQKELKGQNRTIREIRQELAGTGIRIDTKGGNTLDKNWSELCDLIPALDREAADKDMLDQLLNVIAAEKNAARNEYTANMDMEVASMVIDAASNLVPEIVTDKKSMQLIRETLNFIAEMSTEAEESAKALEELNSLMARLQKKGGEAKSTLGRLESNIQDAIAYNNELSTQSEQANWLTERRKLIDQLKSEHTQEMLRQQAEFRLKIEKDKTARGLMNENMALRRRIHTNITRVRNLLMKESVKQNVPEHMKGLAREMLDLIVRNDMSGRKITGLDLKMLQETRRVLDAWEAQDGKYNPDQLKGLDEAVQDAVYNALEGIKAGIDFYNASTKGSELTVNLQAFRNALTRISEGVSEITGIINAERSIALGDRRVAVEDQAYKVQESAGDRRANVLTGRLGQTITALRKAVTSGNLTPEYFFKMLKNDGLNDLWEEYHRAENRNGLELAKSKARLDEIAQKYGYKNWDTDARQEVKLASGSVNMTLGQIMSLYATWKREHTLGPSMSQHLQNGGFYVEEYDPRKGIIGRRVVDLKAHRVTEADMEMVNGLLTDEQKKFVDDIVAYMSTDMSELGNEASMKAYGIRMYKESYYFPFKMWDGIKARASNDSGSAAAANDRAFHPSFSKTRLHGANNALMLGDFMTTAADHIVGMINYATMGLANENLQKVLNAQVPEGERLDQMTRRTIRTVLEEAYGRTMTDYLAKLQEQLNGGAVRVDRTIYDRMLTLFRKNAVAGSMSVALQQPLSYIRAAMMINPKYMTEALAREYWKGSYQERMKHSGISVIKDMGRFDMGFGQGAREYITPEGKEGKIRKAWDAVTDKATILPELMDRWTWNRLWVAVKAEQHAQHPDMDVHSEEFLDMVGERFNDIVRKTQVYDSTLTKSQNMRSQNPFVKSITSFMAEPTLSLNVLADAVQNAKEKGGKVKLAKALATFALSAMAQAAAKALMSTGRSPDDKKTWWENFMYRYVANVINEGDPLNLIPGYNDLITLLKNGKLEDDAMGVIGKLFTAGEKLLSTTGNPGDYRTWEDGVGQVVQLITQLPAKNIMRDLRAMYNWFIGKLYADRPDSAAVIRLQTEASLMTADNLLGVIMAKLGEAGYKVTNTAYYSRMYNAAQAGNKEEVEAIREYLTLGKGVKEETIDSNLRTMTRKGNLIPALEANSVAEITKAIKELQEFGAQVKDIKSQITKEMKPKYLEADAAGKVKIRDAIQKAYKAMGLTAADADKVINGWKDE